MANLLIWDKNIEWSGLNTRNTDDSFFQGLFQKGFEFAGIQRIAAFLGEVDVVGSEKSILESAIGIGKVVPEVEHVDFRVAVELEGIERGVCLLDILVEAVSGRMRRKNLRHNEFSARKLFTQIGHAHLDAFGSRFNAGFRREEHVVVADHEQDDFGLKSGDTAVVEAPKNILCLVATDADVDGFISGKVLCPSFAPLNRDAVADEKCVNRASVGLHGFNMRLMQLQPGIAAEIASDRNDRPEMRKVFVSLATGTPIVLRFVNNIGPLFRRERPARLLRFRRDVWILHGCASECDSKRDRNED